MIVLSSDIIANLLRWRDRACENPNGQPTQSNGVYSETPTSGPCSESFASAHLACSAISASSESAKRLSSSVTREYASDSRATPEFPSATHALRTSPRHFARFTALPRKIWLKSSCESDASHSSSGENNERPSSSIFSFPFPCLLSLRG